MDDILNRLDRIETKIDTVVDHMGVQNVRLEVYNAELQKHIEGVQLARQENAVLKDLLDAEKEKIATQLKPLQDHVTSVNANMKLMIKLGAFLAGLAGILGTIKSYIH